MDGTRLGTSYQIEPDHEEETGFHERGRKKKGSEKRKKQDFMREEERKKGSEKRKKLTSDYWTAAFKCRRVTAGAALQLWMSRRAHTS